MLLLSFCFITSWTVTTLLLYNEAKQMLCKRQRGQNRDGELQQCGLELDEQTRELTSTGSIHTLTKL